MDEKNQESRPPRPTERVKMRTVGKLKNRSGHALTDRRPQPKDDPDE